MKKTKNCKNITRKAKSFLFNWIKKGERKFWSSRTTENAAVFSKERKQDIFKNSFEKSYLKKKKTTVLFFSHHIKTGSSIIKVQK